MYITKTLKTNVIHWPKKQKKSFSRKLQQKELFQINSFGVLSNLFLTNNGCISNDFLSVEKDGDLISHVKELVELFNQNYIDIVENSSWKKVSSLGDFLNASEEEITVKENISVDSNYRSIQKTKSIFNTDSKFDLRKPTSSDVNKIIKSLNTNKATKSDAISAKFV